MHILIFPVCYPSSSKKSFKTCLWFRLQHINVCAWLKKQSAARGACEGRVTRREILGDFALFLNLTSALLLGLRRRPFSLRLFLLLCQQCHQTRWRRCVCWDFEMKLSFPNLSWVQHHCQQFWLPDVQAGSWTQVKRKNRLHIRPLAAKFYT